MIYLYMYCFIYSKSKFVCKFYNNLTNSYTFDLFITFLTVICLRFVRIVEDQNLEIISLLQDFIISLIEK